MHGGAIRRLMGPAADSSSGAIMTSCMLPGAIRSTCGLPRASVNRHIDSAMVKAIARAFRWREMLENGTHATIAEIAAAEKINESYVGRVLRLTLLAPDIIEAILDGRQPAEVTLAVLIRQFPVGWRAGNASSSGS